MREIDFAATAVDGMNEYAGELHALPLLTQSPTHNGSCKCYTCQCWSAVGRKEMVKVPRCSLACRIIVATNPTPGKP